MGAKKFADSFKTASKLMQKFLTVEKFVVQITAGTGSAPSTAISTGMLWATVYNVIGVIGNVVYGRKYDKKAAACQRTRFLRLCPEIKGVL